MDTVANVADDCTNGVTNDADAPITRAGEYKVCAVRVEPALAAK